MKQIAEKYISKINPKSIKNGPKIDQKSPDIEVWRRLGGVLRRLGASWGHLKAIWRRLGGILGPWGRLASSWGVQIPLGLVLAPS